MDPLLQFILALAIIITVAKTSGYLSTSLGQPAVLGELLAGLILGPTVLNMLNWPVFDDPHLAETLSHLADLGVLLLLFIAGLEIDLDAMAQAGRPALLAGTLGVAVPVAAGTAVGLAFGLPTQTALFTGLILGATSVSISAQTLMELNKLRTRVGVTLLSAAIVDDIVVILAVSLFTALVGSGVGMASVGLLLLKVIVFLVAAIYLGRAVVPVLAREIDRLPVSEGVMAFVLVVTLIYAWLAEAFAGVAAVTGAFLAGMVFATSPLRSFIEARIHTLAYSWLVPIFFVGIGLAADARDAAGMGLLFTLAVLVAAILSKVVGGGAGGLLGGMSPLGSLRLGVGMASRGEVGLIVATIGLGLGVIDSGIFATVVVLVLVSSITTPIVLKLLYDRAPKTEV